jgi:hypothetical protein
LSFKKDCFKNIQKNSFENTSTINIHYNESYALSFWKQFKENYQVIVWNAVNIISAAKIYDQPEVADALSIDNSHYDEVGLAKLFLLDTIGGYIIETGVSPKIDIFKKFEYQDLFTVEGGLSVPQIDMRAIGARPRLRCIMNARDILLHNMIERKNNMSAAIILRKSIAVISEKGKFKNYKNDIFWNFYMKECSLGGIEERCQPEQLPINLSPAGYRSLV